MILYQIISHTLLSAITRTNSVTSALEKLLVCCQYHKLSIIKGAICDHISPLDVMVLHCTYILAIWLSARPLRPPV